MQAFKRGAELNNFIPAPLRKNLMIKPQLNRENRNKKKPSTGVEKQIEAQSNVIIKGSLAVLNCLPGPGG